MKKLLCKLFGHKYIWWKPVYRESGYVRYHEPVKETFCLRCGADNPTPRGEE